MSRRTSYSRSSTLLPRSSCSSFTSYSGSGKARFDWKRSRSPSPHRDETANTQHKKLDVILWQCDLAKHKLVVNYCYQYERHMGLMVGDFVHEIRKLEKFRWGRPTMRYKKTQKHDPSWNGRKKYSARRVGQTRRSDDEIAEFGKTTYSFPLQCSLREGSTGKQIVKSEPYYNLIHNNCQHFVRALANEICLHYPTTLSSLGWRKL